MKLPLKVIIAGSLLCCLFDASANPLKGRTTLGGEWKISERVKLETGYEFRSKSSLCGVERHMLKSGLNYKFNRYFSVGMDYDFIAHYTSSFDLQRRHRIGMNVTGVYDFGMWSLSLRERVQYTHKSYAVNMYQEPRNEVVLKSRVKLSYRGLSAFEPYTYIELRNTLNAPSFTATYLENSGTYTNYTFIGYNDVYVNRYRGAIGALWQVDKRNGLDLRVMLDYTVNKHIDINPQGSILESYYIKHKWTPTIVVGYVFSF